MSLQLRIYPRDLNAAEYDIAPGVSWEVTEFTWHAIGGPLRCDATGRGDEIDVSHVIYLLRCPVEVQDEYGETVWWGYIHNVRLEVGALEIGVSLDDMANMVTVMYSYTPDGEDAETVETLVMSLDELSVAEYGAKERKESLSDATEELATAMQAAVLNQRKYPIPTLGVKDSPTNESNVKVDCRGWWSTLDWRYYENTGTDTVETTTIMKDILSIAGQFFLGTVVDESSGIQTKETIDGEDTARKEMENLLMVGTSSANRMIATVTRQRFVRVYPAPLYSPASAYRIDRNGRVMNAYATEPGPGSCPVGQWMAIEGIAALRQVRYMGDPSVQFIEEATWKESSQRWTVTPQGVKDVWNVLTDAVEF